MKDCVVSRKRDFKSGCALGDTVTHDRDTVWIKL